MNNGYYTGLSGQVASMNNFRVILNNSANSATPGFKSDKMLFNKFMHKDVDKEYAMPMDIKTYVNQAQGSLNHTGNVFDFAISGKGYFAVQNQAGVTTLTRNGRFQKRADGALQDGHGQSVLSTDGNEINLSGVSNDFDVYSDGRIFANGSQIGAIGIFATPEGADPIKGKYGDLVVTNADLQMLQISEYRMNHKMLENSNTDSIANLAELGENKRHLDSIHTVMSMYRDNLRVVFRAFGKSID
jgi:flagellar basal-body rod protein FlgF